jgi:hypothetical protein
LEFVFSIMDDLVAARALAFQGKVEIICFLGDDHSGWAIGTGGLEKAIGLNVGFAVFAATILNCTFHNQRKR